MQELMQYPLAYFSIGQADSTFYGAVYAASGV